MAMVVALAAPAVAAAWSDKVTGEATMTGWYPGLTVMATAWEDASGAGAGQLSYDYWVNGTQVRKWHASVEAICFDTTSNGTPYVTAIGPATAQDGTSLPAGDTVGMISVLDSSTGPDRVRAGTFADMAEAMTSENWCDTSAAPTFPAIVGTGGYTIVSR